jgi:mannosyltransferase OCH1-like enzyme
VTDGAHGALSNNILGARPNHPFWVMMTESLIPWGYNYVFPYLTVSYASGQWFETAIWEKYHASLSKDAAGENKIYRILVDMRDGTLQWIFFTQGRGGSWNNWDTRLFSFLGNDLVPWIGRHILFLILGAAIIGGLVWYRRRRRARRLGHSKASTAESTELRGMV